MYTVTNSSRLGLPPQAEIDYAVDVLQRKLPPSIILTAIFSF
jgi:hypothetical protein